ncbi:hypothetical protein M514_23978 [Trichuris suis]|uniref:HTH CENPB-type domain-containing protein n=1 Tax=Trichuris suis TaxID=68888 RepID=A0A085N2Y4_9BILA|nr:hypothetical protein M514_23978 [Trichuris suis]
MLKERAADPTQVQMFRASRGWFQCFKGRHNLHNMKGCGEMVRADTERAVAFKDESDQIIADEEYLPEQILNVD